MPRTTIPQQQLSRAGTVVSGTGVSETVADPANDHQVANDGKVIIIVRNTDAGAQTVTFVTPGTVDTQAVADRTDSIPAGVQRMYGPFPPSDYGDVLQIDCTNANLRFMAFHL